MFSIHSYLKRTAFKLTRRRRRWRRFKAILNDITVIPLQNRCAVNLFYFDYRRGPRLKRIDRLKSRLTSLWQDSLEKKESLLDQSPLVDLNPLKGFGVDRVELTALTSNLSHAFNRFDRRKLVAAALWSKGRSKTLNQVVQLKWCPLKIKENRIREVQSILKYRVTGRAQRRIKTVVFPLLNRLKRSGLAKGAEFRCHGRFDRQQRAQHHRIVWGASGKGDPSQTKAKTFVTFPLRFGAVAITLTVNLGHTHTF